MTGPRAVLGQEHVFDPAPKDHVGGPHGANPGETVGTALGPNVDVGTPKSLRPFPGDQVLAATVELWVAGLPGGSTGSTALAMDGAADLATVTTRR